MKKILAILLSVTMLLGCVVFSTVASAETTAFEIGAGVNVIPVADENVVKTFGSLATITDCDYGKAWSELRTGDKLEFVIDVETAGTYYFSLAYAWGGKSSFTLAVDGTDAATIVCPTTGGWSAPIAVNDPTAVELAAGAHDITLTLTEPDGGLNSFFAINICDSDDAEITYPTWRYAASAMPGAATGAKDAAGQTVAYHANVLQAFDGFYFSMATWSVSTAYCKIAVYKWAYNYENTLAGEPIATAEFNPMADNTANGIDFDEALPAGEYLFYIYDTSAEKCGIYCCEAADEKGVTYVGGVVDSTWIPGLGIKINEGFGEDTEILGVASAETEVPAPVYEVAVDTEGKTENHGLTITNGVGPLGLSYQFKTNAAFKAFAPKLGLFDSTKTIDISITKRGSEEPIQTWTKTGDDETGNKDAYWNDRINGGAWVTCELDEELPAGEYIVYVGPNEALANDVVWKLFEGEDAYGLWESVGSFEGEKEKARTNTPAFKVTFTEEVADGAYFAKAGEPNVVAVDNQGAEVGHGLTITNNVGGVSVSYQFKTTAAFEEFSIMFGFFSADKNINVTIYDLEGELLQTWNPSGNEGVAADDSTGAWTSFALDEALPAGEYLIVVDPCADTSDTRDVIWKRYDVVDANGIFHSTLADEDAWAVNATPCLTFTFIEFAEDGVYFAKAGETPDEPEPPVVEDTTAEDTTAEDTTAEDTTAEDTTAADTTAEDTTAADTTVADTTVADTTVADTTAAGTEAGTAAGTGATGTKAPATTTAAAAAEGCKAVVGSMSAIALVAIASAAAVVLKKKED